jgi:hypothetical protein
VTLGAIVAVLLVGAGEGGDAVYWAQRSVQRRVIIRVPTEPQQPTPRRTWREKGGPKCIDASALAGAQVGPDGVDLLLRGGTRLRAKLVSRCPALNYYSGFYVRPGADGRICQDRDSIRTRSGAACEIDRFRRLVPVRARD